MSDSLYVPFNNLRPSPEEAKIYHDAFDDVLDSGRYIGGLQVEAFEKEWAEYCGVDYCVAVGNGHDALMLACRYFKEQHSPWITDIYTPWKTCLPTWSAVRNSGCTPTPILDQDIDAAIAVHIYGQISFLGNTVIGKPLIEDCAQAHGASYAGVQAGRFGDVGCWSFYPTKNLGALGDAGAVTTDDVAIADFVRSRRNYGTRSETGLNSRMDAVQAAILRNKLPYLKTYNAMRAENAQAYLDTIHKDGFIKLPIIDDEDDHPCWHQFAIETALRDDLREWLSAHGVETMIHYPKPPYDEGWLISEAELWCMSTLSLPVAPHVRPSECQKIGELINEWMDLQLS